MKNVVTIPLKHKIGTSQLSSAELKKVVMQVMENFVSQQKQLATANEAIRELQKKCGMAAD